MTVSSGETRQALLAFVGTQILPHEHDLRQWLKRLGVKAHELDDIVQEVYCRMLRLDSVEHIADGRAYFFRSARNVMLEQVRKNRIVSIMTVQNIDDLGIADHTPSPEAAVSARAELDKVLGLIKGLPDRCRRVFELRKIQGMSQAQTAHALSLTENVVEKETAKGLSLLLQRMAGHAPSKAAFAKRDASRSLGAVHAD